MPERPRMPRQSIARFERLLRETSDPELAEAYRAELAAAKGDACRNRAWFAAGREAARSPLIGPPSSCRHPRPLSDRAFVRIIGPR